MFSIIKNKSLVNKFKSNIDTLLLFFVILSIYSYIVYFSSKRIDADFYAHVEHIININQGIKSYPPNFFFYFIANLLSFFTSNRFFLYIVLILLLSVSTIFKYIITKRIVSDYIFADPLFKRKFVILISFICFFIYAIPDPFLFFIHKRMYLGKIAPVVWHNSTSILLFPFALLLFWKQLQLIIGKHKNTTKNILTIVFLIFLNIIIKPSFIFVFIPATFLILVQSFLIKKIKFRELLFRISPLLFGLLLIILSSSLIYLFQYGSFQAESSSISINLFFIYKLFSPLVYFPVALLFSLFLPILSIVFYPNILKFKPFSYAFILFVFSILIAVVFVESGPRLYHLNFLWQNIFTSYLLFLTNLIFLFNNYNKNLKFDYKFIILMMLMFCHFISGFLYLFKYLLTENYH